MKKPNSRRGLNALARLARKDMAVVKVVAAVEVAACAYVNLRRLTGSRECARDCFQKSVYTKSISEPRPITMKTERHDISETLLLPLTRENRARAEGIDNITRKSP